MTASASATSYYERYFRAYLLRQDTTGKTARIACVLTILASLSLAVWTLWVYYTEAGNESLIFVIPMGFYLAMATMLWLIIFSPGETGTRAASAIIFGAVFWSAFCMHALAVHEYVLSGTQARLLEDGSVRTAADAPVARGFLRVHSVPFFLQADVRVLVQGSSLRSTFITVEHARAIVVTFMITPNAEFQERVRSLLHKGHTLSQAAEAKTLIPEDVVTRFEPLVRFMYREYPDSLFSGVDLLQSGMRHPTWIEEISATGLVESYSG